MLRPPYNKYEVFYIYAFREGHPVLRTLDDPDLIGYWEEDGLGVLFFHRPKDALIDELSKLYNLHLEIKEAIPYEQWNEKRLPQPFKVGNITLAPLWFEGEFDLRFDPSVVFGEGRHPTTQIVLELSWEFFKEVGIPERVLDIGCGSGILTLFWAKLGAKVYAIDINPLCVAVTKKNLLINNLEADVREADLRNYEIPQVNLVLANLYKALLIELLNRKDFQQIPHALISGITVGMEPEVKKSLEKTPFKVYKRLEKENWVGYHLCQS